MKNTPDERKKKEREKNVKIVKEETHRERLWIKSKIL